MSKFGNEAHEKFVAGGDTVGTTAQVAGPDLQAYRSVKIKASLGNTNNIYVGHSASVTTTTGYELDAGEEVEIFVDSLGKVFVIGGAADQDYSWLVT